MRKRDAVSLAVGGVALAGAVFGIGGAPRPVQAVVAMLVAMSIVPLVWSRRVFARVSPLIAMLCAAVALTSLQLIPLPSAIVDALDPVGQSLRDDGAQALGFSSRSTLTRDVPGTLRGLAFFATLLGTAIVATRFARTERERYFLLSGVGASSALVAVIVAIHALLGIDDVYGIYRPRHASPALLGPFLNTNHLGCFLAMGAVLNASLVCFRRQPPLLRVWWLVASLGCAALALFTLSRGAALALGGGVLVLAVGLASQRMFPLDPSVRRRRASFATTSLPLAVVALCTVILVIYASGAGVAQQLSRTSLQEISEPRSKFATWRASLELVRESPWVGVGRGAFEPSFTRIHPASAFSTFSHVENEYLQIVVDFGIPATLILALLFAWWFVVAVRGWREGPLAIGALASLGVLFLQNNFDFGIELLGIAIPATVIAATLTQTTTREATGGQLLRARISRCILIICLVALSAALWLPMTTTVEEEHEQVAEARSVSLRELQAAAARHPLDYYPYAVAAQLLNTRGDPTAIRLLNHALTLHPTLPDLHVMSARILLATGYREQAALEYSAALHASTRRKALLAEVSSKLSVELAARAIPFDEMRVEDTIRILVEELGRSDVAQAWLLRSLTLRPDDLHKCERLFAMAIPSANVELLRRLETLCPHFEPANDKRNHMARTLLEHGRASDALQALGDVSEWRGNTLEKAYGWLTMCDAHMALKDWDETRRCLRRLEISGLASPELLSEITSRLVRIELPASDTEPKPSSATSAPAPSSQ